MQFQERHPFDCNICSTKKIRALQHGLTETFFHWEPLEFAVIESKLQVPLENCSLQVGEEGTPVSFYKCADHLSQFLLIFSLISERCIIVF